MVRIDGSFHIFCLIFLTSPPSSQVRINSSLHIFCLSFLPLHPSLLHPKLKIYHYSTQHDKQVSSPPTLHFSVWKQLSMTDTSQNTQVHSITPFSCTFTSLLPNLYRHCLTCFCEFVKNLLYANKSNRTLLFNQDKGLSRRW